MTVIIVVTPLMIMTMITNMNMATITVTIPERRLVAATTTNVMYDVIPFLRGRRPPAGNASGPRGNPSSASYIR